jgi:protein-glutamine gamma-glutamyltransferase
LWSIPQDDQSISGLSDSMSPGDISKLSMSEAVVFRVDFENAVPQNENLYWRGPVLGQQLGKSWVPYSVAEREKLEYEPQGPLTKYRVTLQPHNKPWLFALDLPAIRPNDAFFLADFQLRSRMPVTALRAYEMASHLNYRVGTDLPPRERSRYLAIDRRLNPRAIAYGQKLAEEHTDQKVLVETLMKLYNTQFTYTLEPPKLGANPMDEFLFDTKQGFCEHYAGSFVLVLRAAGIPSRVVTGYQGGEINPITRQLVVRQSDAHAWSEVWFADLGWVRIDPTFAVSPLRINRGFSAAIGPVGMFNTMMEADKLGVLKQLRYSWDAVNNQWNQWVVGFNNDRQKSLMDQLGVKDMDWRTLAIWLIAGIVLASGSVGLFLMLRMYRTRKEPVVAAYEALCAKLARAGVTRAPHEGPVALLARLDAKRPKLAQQVAPLFESYVALRYSPLAEPKTNDETVTTRQKLREFISAVRQLRIVVQ